MVVHRVPSNTRIANMVVGSCMVRPGDGREMAMERRGMDFCAVVVRGEVADRFRSGFGNECENAWWEM